VLLDREELSVGVWYVSVENAQESEDALVFDMTVACLASHDMTT
jgi:hypothetical protein